jgi:phospholipid/cholesterol/gamma-HCH transport system substrate-binding protein
MENRAHALWAGLFTIGLVLALVGAVAWFGQRGREPRVPYVLVSHVSVSGLNVQAPVRYRGVEVGRVERVRFDPEAPQNILIDVTISPRTPVTEVTFARLGSQGITGIAYVELDDEGKRGREVSTSWAQPARIEMRPSFLQEFGDAGQLLLVRVNEIALRLNQLLNEENQGRLSRSIDSITRLTDRLATFQDRLGPTLDNLPSMTHRAETLMAEAEKLSVELEALSREVRQRGDAVERVGQGVEKVGVAANDLATQTMPNINRVLAKLERATENLNRALEAQARDPRSLLFGAAPPEPGPGEPGHATYKQRGAR